MASSGIRDEVAVIGMGCTRFGELWDKGVDDLLTEAATAAASSAGLSIHDLDAFWLGHHDVRRVRRHALEAVETRLQAGDPGGELLRDRLGGLSQRLLRRRIGRLRPGYGHRRGEAQGHRVLGADRYPRRRRRHRPGALVAGGVLLPRPLLRAQVRRGQGPAQGGDEPDRLQEPPERGPEPAGAVPEGGLHGDHRQGAARRGRPRRLRLQRRLRRSRPPPSSAGPRMRTATATTRST